MLKASGDPVAISTAEAIPTGFELLLTPATAARCSNLPRATPLQDSCGPRPIVPCRPAGAPAAAAAPGIDPGRRGGELRRSIAGQRNRVGKSGMRAKPYPSQGADPGVIGGSDYPEVVRETAMSHVGKA